MKNHHIELNLKLPSTLTFTTINMLNYLEPPNAYYDFENIYSQDEWQQKQNWFSNAIQTLDSDVIGFQEVFSPDSLASLLQTLGYPYFEVVDSPHIESDYLYTSPVVAIASRYPIIQVRPVTPNLDLLKSFNAASDFSFNRTPVHATIDLPHLGATDCYVVHFKSQRPSEPHTDTDKNKEPSSDSLNQLHTEQLGRWLSTVQRGFESNLLHKYISQQRLQSDQPIMVMGDFNKPIFHDEFNGLLSYMLNRDEASKNWLSHFRLRDSWDLYHQLHQEDLLEHRKPTHYYGATGSVLDYILLSNEFDCQNSSSLMEVHGFTVTDKHIVNPSFEVDQFSTDHALVSVTVRIRE